MNTATPPTSGPFLASGNVCSDAGQVPQVTPFSGRVEFRNGTLCWATGGPVATFPGDFAHIREWIPSKAIVLAGPCYGSPHILEPISGSSFYMAYPPNGGRAFEVHFSMIDGGAR